MPPIIAAIVNLHDEGEAAVPSLISAWRAVERVRASGVDTAFVLMLDSANDETTAVAHAWSDRGATVLTCEVADLGAARNEAAAQVDAQWLAFLDADDLWGEEWLVHAHAQASATPPSAMIDVWHPAVNVVFGDHHSLLHHIASTDPAFSWARFRLHNSWTALAFVRRAHLLALPYPRNNLRDGYGYEDWSWNAEVLRRGGRHHVVDGTCHFIRRTNADSLLGQSVAALRSPYPAADLALHLDAERLPGATRGVSARTTVDSDLPPTHRRAEVALSSDVYGQIRLASTIEPEVLKTLHFNGQPERLAQNFNTHVTTEQQALESIDLAAAAQSFPTAAALCDASELLPTLDPAQRAKVVAETILDPYHQALPRGSSVLIDEAIAHYPQLANSTW